MGQQGYCVKCRISKEMKETEQFKTKKGIWAVKGRCPDCNTKMCRIIGKAIK